MLKSKPWLKVLLITLAGVLVGLPLLSLLLYRLSDVTNGEMTVAGEKRRYLLYVPPTYDPAHPTALVISLHGFAQWPAHQSLVTHWKRLADEHGFILVHPAGTGRPLRWRANTADAAQQPDVAFLDALITQLQSTYAIDPQRIYINGLSNGGGMSFVASCALADRIAAWGGVGGAYLYPWEACTPSRPVPAILFHGEADPIVPYQGGPSRMFNVPFPAIPAWVNTYAQRNGCTLPAQQEQVSDEVTRWRYPGCQADVVFYAIAGGGHTWPGGTGLPESLVGPTNKDIDATGLMWEFFAAHPLPSQTP